MLLHTFGKRSNVTRIAKSLPSLNRVLALSTQNDNSEKKKRVVIVGGVAGGATAAARISRLTSSYDVTVIERSPDVSFANCGLPYYIGREIIDRNRLALQTPVSLSRQLGVNVKTNTEVTSIERQKKTIIAKDLKENKELTLDYDYLILSPGASPIRPKMEGINHSRVLTLRNLQDMDYIDHIVTQRDCKEVVVIGAGFIGLEMVEQLKRIGKDVHLVEGTPTVLPQADPEMSEFLHAPLIENGVQLHLNDKLKSFEKLSESRVRVNLDSGKSIDADLAVLCIGVKPESSLASNAGLNVNTRGYITVNEYMQTNDPNIYAVGDVIETKDLVFPERKTTVALGNIANMQARIAADHLVTGKSLPYRGSLGTSIVRAFDNVLALTGWNEKRLKAEKIPYSTTTITAYAHASYYPGAMPVTMKILFDPTTGRVLGAQAYGIDGVDKRIDVIAAAITGGLTVDELSLMQLTYSPPFGSARDVVNVAGLAARNIRDGLVKPVYELDTSAKDDKVQLVDVRPRESARNNPIPNSINLPYTELRSTDLSKILQGDKEYQTICAWGKTAYFSSRILANAGYKSSTLIGGMTLNSKPKPIVPSKGSDSSPSSPSEEKKTDASTVISVDCSGLSCPGPLLKLKEQITVAPANALLKITATDPGFKSDVKAFAEANNFLLKDLTTTKGVIHATLQKKGREEGHDVANTAAGARKGATIVCFSEEFDKVLASFVIANGAAAMGGPVTMFFTFWGLNVLRDPHRTPKESKPIIDSMFHHMMPKGKDHLPLSHFNFGGMGAELMKYVMKNKHLPNLPDLIASAKAQNIRFVACTMSMEAMGIRSEELIDGVELGGVADYLASAEKTGTNLFI